MHIDHITEKLRIACIRIFILWLPFSLGCLLAIPISFWAVLTDSVWGKNMLLQMDKLAAVTMHWDGHNTVSAECGKLLAQMKDQITTHCIFCVVLCWAISRLDAGHCHRNAKEDGLLPSEDSR